MLRKTLKVPVEYNLPCRKIETADLTLAHVIAAVAKEQTGLVVKTILRELGPAFGVNECALVRGVDITVQCIQLNFFVEVEDGEVIIAESRVKLLEIEDGMIESGHEMVADMSAWCKSLIQYIFVDKLIEESVGSEDFQELEEDEVPDYTSNGSLGSDGGGSTLDESLHEET